MHVDKSFKKIEAGVRPPPHPGNACILERMVRHSLPMGWNKKDQSSDPSANFFSAEFLTANRLARGGGGVDSSPKSLVPGQMTDDAKYLLM